MTTFRRFLVIVTMTALPMIGAGLGHTSYDEICHVPQQGMFYACADLDSSTIVDAR
jgi:hypothetical protein